MTTIIENGKRYEVDGDRVVAAVEVEPTEMVELTTNDRVAHGSKLGTIVGLVPSVYGSTAVVKFDDGSMDELLLEDLEPSNTKMASAENDDSLEAEYEAYLALPTDTADEIKIKESKARELNLRAKALATNGKNALADQITFDRIVTATAVDILDLKDAAIFAQASEEKYLDSLPKYRLPDQVSGGFGLTRGGDASWLASAAEEIESTVIEDGELAQKAQAIVSNLTREQLEDDSFMSLALGFAKEIYAEEAAKDKLATLVREARAQKLGQDEPVSKTASTVAPVDMDGKEFDLEETPVEAIFGV